MVVLLVILFDEKDYASYFEFNCDKDHVRYLNSNLSKITLERISDQLVEKGCKNNKIIFYSQTNENNFLHVLKKEYKKIPIVILKNFINKNMMLEVKINGRKIYFESKTNVQAGER